LIETILGYPLGFVGNEGATNRPIFYQLLNAIDLEKPRVTIKRDSLMKEYDQDTEVSLEDLGKELGKRNTQADKTPIFVTFEHKYVHNMTLIDTPGLNVDDEDIEDNVLELTEPLHRLILCVDQAGDWAEKTEIMDVVKKADPELTRTAFVYTKFFDHLQNYNNARGINSFLSNTVPDVKSFFLTGCNEEVREKATGKDAYREKICQAYRRDLNLLELLQFDKSFEPCIGSHHLRRHLMHHAWKSYKVRIPKILRKLLTKKQATQAKLTHLHSQLASLDSQRLRGIASTYVVEFLQTIERLIAGTSEGNPVVNGQKLAEEKAQHGDGEWYDSKNRAIRFDPEEWNIPYWNSQLYGGQQFERLLEEFKAVAEHTDMSEITRDDVATAAGLQKGSGTPNYAWAAADLAQQKTQEEFVQLVEQVISRAVYVMKRLTDIVERIRESSKKEQKEEQKVDVNNIDQYPYFTYHVRDLYNKFIDSISQKCKEKCMDEFYSSKTIYWDLTEFGKLSSGGDEEAENAVPRLAMEAFGDIKQRVTRSVVLKLYNFFLLPMQTELWNEIQGKVTCLSDEMLDQIFEVSATKQRLRTEERKLEDIVAECGSAEVDFLVASDQFSHAQEREI